jgi:hypothetical protein
MKHEKQIIEIKKSLKHGDMTVIAQLTGFTQQYISQCFNGKRRMHPLILETAQKLIETRRQKVFESLTNQYK